MRTVLMIAADVHDRMMLVKYACGLGPVYKRSFCNRKKVWRRMLEFFKAEARKAGAPRLVFVYEASGVGFALYDFLVAEGIEAHVLAPSKIVRSPRERRRKTDEADATKLLEVLKAHVLAGNALPAITVPDPQLRDDREIVRTRTELGVKVCVVKTQVRTLLKRQGREVPEGLGGNWSKSQRAWLRRLSEAGGGLAAGARVALCSLLRQLAQVEEEIRVLDVEIAKLGRTERYRAQVKALDALTGVRVLTALLFLTEMGDVRRFENRRQVGSYVGLVPGSWESGATHDRKGHITRQGSARLRRVLCQATWARIRCDAETQEVYARLKAKNPKKKMIAVVACMRHLAIRMWHVAVEAQKAA